MGSQAAFEEGLVKVLNENEIDFIVLAGFMCILSENFTKRYPKRIINVHPSLIPSFCGKGFYGLHVHEAALNYGVKVTGATVHFVNEIPDGGEIILQKAVEILENDTIVDAKELNRRVKMLRTELTEQRGGWYNKRFVEGVQSYVDALNLERRMKLYTIVSSPEQMGTALRIDKIHAGADTARIVEQKRVLRSLYTIEEWNRFEENYNRK